MLELVAAFQADAARADHRQIQRGALGERVGLGQGLEGEHEGILHRLRGLADGDPHTQKPRRAGLAGRLHGGVHDAGHQSQLVHLLVLFRGELLVLALDAPTQHHPRDEQAALVEHDHGGEHEQHGDR